MPKVLRDAYLAAAPHPENLCIQRMRNFKDISVDTMWDIRSPAYRLIPHSRLAVLPGTDHMSLTSRTAWLTPMINESLYAPLPSSR
jgi:hypothetical protein